MATADLISLIVTVTIVFVVGTALNMDILLVYIGNLKNGLSLGLSDKIHLTKALVNLSLHFVMTTQCILFAFLPHSLFTSYIFLWNMMMNMLLVSYSYWLMALLCVYYCTNLTNCGHHIFVWLKRSFSSYLHHILLVLGLGSIAIGCPVLWVCTINPVGNATDQNSFILGAFLQNIPYRVMSSLLGCFLPFTIALVSTAFTSWSLINHMWTMKQNNPGFTRSKFQTEINATRTMILFLLIAVTYNVTQMLLNFILPEISDVEVIMIWLFIMSFPLSEAIIIIQSSSKFRKTLLGKFFIGKKRNSEAET